MADYTDDNGFRKMIAEKLEKKYNTSFIKNWIKFESRNKSIRLVIAISKFHGDESKDTDYWFTCQTSQIDYLSKAEKGYFILGFRNGNKYLHSVFKLRIDLIEKLRNSRDSRTGEIKKYFIDVQKRGDQYWIYRKKYEFNLESYRIDMNA